MIACTNDANCQTTEKLPAPERIAVRLNSVNTEHFVEDIRCVVSVVLSGSASTATYW
jgi:hypothetical protein